MAVDKEELVRLQGEDSTLRKFKEAKGTMTRTGYKISYKKRGGIWYRYVREKMKWETLESRFFVPKLLRAKVMEVAYDSLFGGYLGVKKTEDRIQTNFFWPGLHDDATSFCRSYDGCQKTVP